MVGYTASAPLPFVPSLRVTRRWVIAHPVVLPDEVAVAIRSAIEELLTDCCPAPLTTPAVKHNMSN
jgi:hypothetical protein